MFTITPIHFNLHELIDVTASVCGFAASQKGLQFYVSIARDVPEYFYGDDIRIRQIVTNIVNNGVKYTKEGSVGLRVERLRKKGKDWLCIKVTDTGIGIKKEDMEAIFDMFRQVDGKTNRGITGTGLGLAISRRLASLMGGDISVESVYGVGSVFTVLLPLTEGDKDMKKIDDNGSFAVSKGEAKVLVVDDNDINRKVALAFLKKHGIDADSAPSGKDAIDMVRKNAYDLVFMDHMMPEMDGLEATKIIRSLEGERNRRLPIVALTANALNGATDEFKAAGMDDCLFKPIVASQLNRILAKWLPYEKLKHD
jgi:CheY-like chemotaxis protein/anti-sigma regulatory factor (Ser/Thr protein kinase)